MDDMYLNIAIDLYEKGIWNEDEFVKKVTAYAGKQGIDTTAIEEFIRRATKKKEKTLDEKKKFLSELKIDDNILKYGSTAVNSMTDDVIEKLYEEEMKSKVDVVNKDENKEAPKRQVVTVKKVVKSGAGEVGKNTSTPIEITHGNKGNVETSSKEKPNPENIFRAPSQNELQNNGLNNAGKPSPENTFRTPSQDELGGNSVLESNQNNNRDHVVRIPSMDEISSFVNSDDSASLASNSDDIPQSEEEFQRQADVITGPEKDSNVRIVKAPSERIEKLKKTKNKAINFFLKTGILVATFMLLGGVETALLTAGYLYYASEIKQGKFNPENALGKAVKKTVEKIMNIGLPKEGKEYEEGGKTR